MDLVFLAVAVLIVVGVALALAGRWNPAGLDDPPARRAVPFVLDGEGSRPPEFDVAVRGYRMDEVDAAVAEVQERWAASTRRLADLQAENAALRRRLPASEGAGPVPPDDGPAGSGAG